MTTFIERAESVGLHHSPLRHSYYYGDQYSQVLYRELMTLPENELLSDRLADETDGFKPGLLAVFTQPPQREDRTYQWKYAGYVSRIYKFIGNAQFTQSIRDSINNVGMPIVREWPILAWNYTKFRNEMIIQNGVNAPQHGDVFPAIIVKNSYDGSGAQSIQFGLETNYNNYRHSFGFSLGEMKQIHVTGASTVVAANIEDYVQSFSTGIVEMITDAFQRQLREQDMFSLLSVIEDLGKRRHRDISAMLAEMTGGEGNMPTAWQMFLAITRYSSLEPNLNMKSLMENAAESVLVIPARMMDVLERLRLQR